MPMDKLSTGLSDSYLMGFRAGTEREVEAQSERVCGACQHRGTHEHYGYDCRINDFLIPKEYPDVPPFGCNRFEKKE